MRRGPQSPQARFLIMVMVADTQQNCFIDKQSKKDDNAATKLKTCNERGRKGNDNPNSKHEHDKIGNPLFNLNFTTEKLRNFIKKELIY